LCFGLGEAENLIIFTLTGPASLQAVHFESRVAEQARGQGARVCTPGNLRGNEPPGSDK
jgi:hypothetical protein